MMVLREPSTLHSCKTITILIRHTNLFVTTRVNTKTFGERSFSCAGPSVWKNFLCVVCVLVKRTVLPPCAADARSRNHLYYYGWLGVKKLFHFFFGVLVNARIDCIDECGCLQQVLLQVGKFC